MTLQTERELFEACMDLAPGQRTAWLAEHCGDSALRERIVRLLRAHDSAQEHGSLEQSPLATARRIGTFDLLETIGEGAMGEVWLAEQTAPVRRRVAVKIVKAGTGSREVIARFELERQALAMMSHPSIAHIVEAGDDRRRPALLRDGVRAGHSADEVLRSASARDRRAPAPVPPDLRGRAARASEGRDPSRPEAGQPAGRRSRRTAVAEGDRLRHRQGGRARSAAEPRAHDDRPPDRHAGVHEPGAGAALAARRRHARRRVFARRRAARVAHRRVALQVFGSERDAGDARAGAADARSGGAQLARARCRARAAGERCQSRPDFTPARRATRRAISTGSC